MGLSVPFVKVVKEVMFQVRVVHANSGRCRFWPCCARKWKEESAMQKRPRKPRPDPKRLCDLAHMADEPKSTDVLGSYTGTAQDGESPVQDADDL